MCACAMICTIIFISTIGGIDGGVDIVLLLSELGWW